MKNTKTILLTALISVVVTSLFFIFFEKLSFKASDSDYIQIKKSELPEIYYAPVIYPTETIKPFTNAEKELLYTGGIKPFLERMESEGYQVISIEVGTPGSEPILLDSVLYQEETNRYRGYKAAIFKNEDSTYSYSPDAPPGYAG